MRINKNREKIRTEGEEKKRHFTVSLRERDEYRHILPLSLDALLSVFTSRKQKRNENK
jgi:phage protein U